MKTRTEKEIFDFVKILWPEVFLAPENPFRWGQEKPEGQNVGMGDIECKIRFNENKSVSLTLKTMYSAPGLDFAQMKKLSEFFETDYINDDDRFSNGGCNTCDYGSSYGFTLTIGKDGK